MKAIQTLTTLRAAVHQAARDVRASSAMMFGVLAPVLIGTLGCSLDFSNWYAAKQSLEEAVQVAALSGADARATLFDAYSADLAVRERLANLLPADGHSPEIQVNSPPQEGAFAGDTRAVEVVADQPQTLMFTSLILGETVMLRARSVAVSAETGTQCVLALAQSAAGAINFDRSANVRLDCGIVANSTSRKAISVAGLVHLGANPLATAGAYTVTGSGLLNMESAPHRGASAVNDPYGPGGRNLQVPAQPVACSHEALVVTGESRLSPGRYCNGLALRSASVYFDPGVYVIDGGTFEIAGSVVTGDGVTFVLTGSGDNHARLRIGTGSELSLAAPAHGTSFAGILFFQDPAAPRSNGGEATTNKLLGTAGLQLSGALYFPAQDVVFSGGDNGGVGCLQIVANRVRFTGNSNVGHNCWGAGIATLASHVVRLAE